MKELCLATDHLTYFCSSDKEFQKYAFRVMIYAKMFFRKHKKIIPKPILHVIMHIIWQLKHPNDYRYNFLSRSIEERKQALNDWVNMKDIIDKTAHRLGNEEIKKLIEQFKKENNLN